MSAIVKFLLILAAIVIVIAMGFRAHWALGVGLLILILLLGILLNRSAIYAMRGNAAYMKGDQTAALALMEKACRAFNSKPRHTIGYAYLLLKSGEPAKAEKLLKELNLPMSKPDEVHMQAKLNLATAYWMQNKREDAVNLLEEVHRGYKNTTVYGNLGYFKILLGDLEQALAFNQEAYEYNDNDLTIIDNLAQNYYLLGRYDDAEQMYVKVMNKSPKHADSYYYYALTLEKLGKLHDAKEQAGLAAGRPLALVTGINGEDIEMLQRRLEELG